MRRARPTICSPPIGLALVRQSPRALLAPGEGPPLADFGFLQPPDFERDFSTMGRVIARGATSSACRSRDHCEGRGGRLESEPPADVGLDRRGQVANVPTAPDSFPTLIASARGAPPLTALPFPRTTART